MTLADIWAGIKAGWEIINKVIDFDAVWNYILQGIDKIVAMF